MRITSVALLLIASMGFVLLGCSDNSAPLLAPTDNALVQGSSSGLAKSAVSASVSGSALMFLDAEGYPTEERSDFLRVCTFNAREYADGSCAGEISAVGTPGKTFAFKGDVVQVKVHGNMGKIVFEYTKPEEATNHYCFYLVIDNGEGAGDPPDMNSGFGNFMPAGLPTVLTWTPEFVLQRFIRYGVPPVPTNIGNIQVRGESYPE